MPETYLLNRDAEETRRLNEQHKVYVTYISPTIDSTTILQLTNFDPYASKYSHLTDHLHSSLGYEIHPTATASLPPNATIADIGTGTGIWLLDIARTNPSYVLHGFDISAAQIHPDFNSSSNLHFHLSDFKQPFPPELLGTFDLVHARLLIFALQAEEWAPAVANLTTLLKPGGYLQWEEINPAPATYVLRTKPTASTTVFQGELNTMLGSGEAIVQSASQVLGLLRDGFGKSLVDVKTDVVSSEREISQRGAATKVMVGVVVGALKQRMASGKEVLDEERVERVKKDMAREVESGAYLQFYVHCFVGRKEG
ncbi:S-adenosyl-L-methionine-dependent methyltransferase [Microthyrium microscopicum]|uniref:S-adenosyl-L-methionine-dependent methyltransferase n=1 Tax=Microthyrium microscopicum TaxID=703497 RepID=A0A6A6UJV4_9PEZI|nr:S-adenosyl-L-methionine-dependent methyltransferase [Microthyrium microscopicum]